MNVESIYVVLVKKKLVYINYINQFTKSISKYREEELLNRKHDKQITLRNKL